MLLIHVFLQTKYAQKLFTPAHQHQKTLPHRTLLFGNRDSKHICLTPSLPPHTHSYISANFASRMLTQPSAHGHFPPSFPNNSPRMELTFSSSSLCCPLGLNCILLGRAFLGLLPITLLLLEPALVVVARFFRTFATSSALDGHATLEEFCGVSAGDVRDQ